MDSGMMEPSVSPENERIMTEDDILKEITNPNFNWSDISQGQGSQQHAEDAVDYEDISDGDLPDEENMLSKEVMGRFKSTQATENEEEENLMTLGTAHDLDDLFGDTDFQSTAGPQTGLRDKDEELLDEFFRNTETGRVGITEADPVQSIEEDQLKGSGTLGLEEHEDSVDPEELEQKRLFEEAASRLRGDDIAPAPAESREELVAQMFPSFRQGATLKLTELLPSGRARYVGKMPSKPPKLVAPTKLSLDSTRDQEKDFRLVPGGQRRAARTIDQHRIVDIDLDTGLEQDEGQDTDEESDFEAERVGGFSWPDFQIICEDWDVLGQSSLKQEFTEPTILGDGDNGCDIYTGIDLMNASDSGRSSAKRRKLNFHDVLDSVPRFEDHSLHDPVSLSVKIGRRIIIDLNDPYLLVSENPSETRSPGLKEAAGHVQGDRLVKRMNERYNISNDQEYDHLKEQVQSKSRNTLGGLAVNHSMPAQRLQWPYYKTKLEKQELRSFHRPIGFFPKMETITFKPPRIVKKKHIKGQDAAAIFNKTKDLSLGDNSHVLLLEYSEQYPVMMSNFGMNSRLINYYRRKDVEDNNRPKMEIGELHVLQPQDTSPLTLFGHIDPGETTPTIYNSMFKAPVFEQRVHTSDFVLIRNATGVDGSNWFLRNVEYVRVVGQQFPSTEVPGPNARKVTTAAKNRLKMVSYRLLRRRKPHRITVGEITPHILDPSGAPSNDMQNRQKLKEFMRFNKEHKEWEMPDGAAIPDEDAIRALIGPEDVCLLEAMQVGSQQLEDAGFGGNIGETTVGDDEEDVEKEGQSLEQQLVPWQTTKNFIQAANNKAMLQLHGEGDPTRRGEAFSMLKISMKGGFKAEGESLEEKLDAQKLKELGGHSYNVAKQQESYDRSIRRIWEKQKEALSSLIEPELAGDEEDDEDDEDPVLTSMMDGPDIQTMRPPQVSKRLRDDESISQLSHLSSASQPGQVLKITRKLKNRLGVEEETTEIVRDVRVIRQYLKLRKVKETQAIDINNLTSEQIANNPEAKKALDRELARLERNKDRRIGREKQKAGLVGNPASPSATPGPDSDVKGRNKSMAGGTGRKCANCGQVGHIKTNKKLCPMLNGTLRQEDNFGEQNFTLSTTQL